MRADAIGMVYGGHFPLGAIHQLKFEIGPAARPLTWTEPRPTGTVVLFDRGVRLGELPLTATAMVPVSQAIWEGQLAPGYAYLTATYGGDVNYKPSEFEYSPGWVQNAQIEVTYPEQVTSGQTYTVSAKVSAAAGLSGTPTGSVTFGNGNYADQVEVPLDGEGFASVTRLAPTVDDPTEMPLYVSYSGDSVFVMWSENRTVTVGPVG